MLYHQLVLKKRQVSNSDIWVNRFIYLCSYKQRYHVTQSSSDGVKRLSSDGIKRLSSDGIKRLSSDGIKRLSSDGIKRLSSDGIKRLSSDGVKRLSSDGVKQSSSDGVKRLSKLYCLNAYFHGINYYNTVDRKKRNMQKWRNAVRQFCKGVPHTRYSVPKEQQISMNVGMKPFYDHASNIIHCTAEYNDKNYYSEFGRKDSIFKEGKMTCKVRRFTLKEQMDSIKFIARDKKGTYRLYDKKSKMPYNTYGKIVKCKLDSVAYVITLDKKLVIADELTHEIIRNEIICHSTLLRGKPGICAGVMKVHHGRIVYIDDNSGHYLPTQEHLYNAVKILDKVIDHNACISSFSSIIVNKNSCIEHEFAIKQEDKKAFLHRMEKVGKDGLTIPQRYFIAIRNESMLYAVRIKNNSLKVGREKYSSISI
ncbi:hypothetical protein LUA82_00860 [Neoehrlichia mikurensis]|uniref:Uncharacterized protein n=1 Tax=Neoehrlichia mikurensis TaxID=89586 RepID=A0A9Q9F5C1_9RICK|nr:hypothetical protein [Neoehrlichia mikurensis]UTO55626.1 hypothetical protein LUA82_00860 [Neoehrlichia mikurensis]